MCDSERGRDARWMNKIVCVEPVRKEGAKV